MNKNYERIDEDARVLVDANPNDFGKSLDVPRFVRDKFVRSLENESNGFFSMALSEEYIVKRNLEFVHENIHALDEGSYLSFDFEREMMSKSFYGLIEKINEGEIGFANCLGFSQVSYYLLSSLGLDVFPVWHKVYFEGEAFNHVSLEVGVGGKRKNIEVIRGNGFGRSIEECVDCVSSERIGNINLFSSVLSDYAISFARRGNREGAFEYLERANEIDSSCSFSFEAALRIYGEFDSSKV